MADVKKEKKEKKEKKAGAMSPRELPVAAAVTQDDKLPEIRINGLQCKLHFVTVYNDQAELTRHVQATVKPGVQDIIVYGLTKDMDTNSVRVGGGRGKATILEVSTTKRFRQEEDKPVDPTAEERAKKIKEIESEIQRVREAIARNGCEREWLKAHAAHVASGSANEKVSSVPAIDDAAKYMRFYAENLERLDAKAVGFSKEIEAHELAIKKLRISPVMPAPVVDREQLEITISIQAEEAGDVLFELSYMLKNASWEAAYETRVSSSNQKMAISYFGLITNRTGEAWDDVQLALSTAKPSTGGVPPEVHTIKVQQKRAPPMMSARMSSMSNSLAPPRAQTFASNPLFSNELADEALPSPSGGGGRPMAVLTSVVEAKATSVSFAIQRRAKVPADGSQRKVVIDVFTLDAVFLYTVVPQLSQNAFLRGTCLNSRNYPFLDGKLSVFMDGNFVATSKMKHTNAGEEFFCHLGTDAAVQVDFKPPKQYQESRMTGLMSRSFVDHTEHLTQIKNTKDFDVRVLMFEQCPRSENEKIKVKVVAPELKENDKSVVLNEFNNVRWEFKIAAGGVVKVPYHFTVEYPNDIDVEYRNG